MYLKIGIVKCFLAEKIIVVKKMVNDSVAAKSVSHEYATYLYGKVCEDIEITSWTKYIILGIRRYVAQYYGRNKKVVLEIPDIVDQDDFRDNCFGINRYNDIDKIHIDNYVSTISNVVLNVVVKVSRYNDIIVNRSIYISVLSSLLRNKLVIIGLDDSYNDYIRFIISMCRVVIYNELSSMIKYKNLSDIAGVLSLDEMLN